MPNHLETLIGRNTGDLGWAQNFRRFGGQKDKYDKYYKDGQLKEGYSTSGHIGGSKKVFEQKIRGEMAGTKDARYRKEGSTFEIYKLPDQKAAPAPSSAPAPPPSPPPEDKSLAVKPVQYSPEIQQAKERVKTYQDGITSGDTTQAIFRSDTSTKLPTNFLNKDKYQFKKHRYNK